MIDGRSTDIGLDNDSQLKLSVEAINFWQPEAGIFNLLSSSRPLQRRI